MVTIAIKEIYFHFEKSYYSVTVLLLFLYTLRFDHAYLVAVRWLPCDAETWQVIIAKLVLFKQLIEGDSCK